MNWHPRGFGGHRSDPEVTKRNYWHKDRILLICADDIRLTWDEQQLVTHLGSRLYGSSRRKCHD